MKNAKCIDEKWKKACNAFVLKEIMHAMHLSKKTTCNAFMKKGKMRAIYF